MAADTARSNERPGALGSVVQMHSLQKSILVVDMVESVRLMSENEASVISRWQAFTRKVRAETVPACGGSHVKSLGDGLMITFDAARDALAAARSIQVLIDQIHLENSRIEPNAERISVRVGVHCGDVVADDLDIYGHSANVASRITSIGGPGEIIVSAYVRDQLTEGLDCELEDLGPHFFKHLNESISVYRVDGHGLNATVKPSKEYEAPLYPTIAVIPFESRGVHTEHLPGDVECGGQRKHQPEHGGDGHSWRDDQL